MILAGSIFLLTDCLTTVGLYGERRFLQKLPNESVFNLFARPGCFAQERETGFYRRVELKTADGDVPSHLAPAMPLDQLIENALQRDTMQWIAGSGAQ